MIRTCVLMLALALSMFACPAMAGKSHVMILNAPVGNPLGKVDADATVIIASGEVLIAIDHEGRLVRVRGPYRGSLSKRIGRVAGPDRFTLFFDTVANMLSSSDTSRSTMGVARSGDNPNELRVTGIDQRFCIIEDRKLSIRWHMPSGGKLERYDFRFDLPERDFSATLGRNHGPLAWIYRGERRFRIVASGVLIQTVDLVDLRNVKGDLILKELYQAGCNSQLNSIINRLAESSNLDFLG